MNKIDGRKWIKIRSITDNNDNRIIFNPISGREIREKSNDS